MLCYGDVSKTLRVGRNLSVDKKGSDDERKVFALRQLEPGRRVGLFLC